jgi:hypothetical protein
MEQANEPGVAETGPHPVQGRTTPLEVNQAGLMSTIRTNLNLTNPKT